MIRNRKIIEEVNWSDEKIIDSRLSGNELNEDNVQARPAQPQAQNQQKHSKLAEL